MKWLSGRYTLSYQRGHTRPRQIQFISVLSKPGHSTTHWQVDYPSRYYQILLQIVWYTYLFPSCAPNFLSIAGKQINGGHLIWTLRAARGWRIDKRNWVEIRPIIAHFYARCRSEIDISPHPNYFLFTFSSCHENDTHLDHNGLHFLPQIALILPGLRTTNTFFSDCIIRFCITTTCDA